MATCFDRKDKDYSNEEQEDDFRENALPRGRSVGRAARATAAKQIHKNKIENLRILKKKNYKRQQIQKNTTINLNPGHGINIYMKCLNNIILSLN